MIIYILFSTMAGMEKKLMEDIIETEYLKEVNIIYGVYDVIAKYKHEDQLVLRKYLMDNVIKLPNIKYTMVLVVSDEEWD